ncbi:hypothetical protein [Hymenobacter tenuis]
MLDFYLIHDSQNLSSKRLKLEHVGGIEDELFFQLQKEGIIEPWLDYYGKFRWGNEIVARMLLKLQQRLPSAPLQKECKSFITILHKATDLNSGLLGYGD